MKQKPLHKRSGRGPAIHWQLWVAAQAGLWPSSETVHWLGVYNYQADSDRFLECKTGQMVLVEKDNVLLEQAYLNTRSSATAVMLAEVTGRMVCNPPAIQCWPSRGARSWRQVWSALSHCRARRSIPSSELDGTFYGKEPAMLALCF